MEWDKREKKKYHNKVLDYGVSMVQTSKCHQFLIGQATLQSQVIGRWGGGA